MFKKVVVGVYLFGVLNFCQFFTVTVFSMGKVQNIPMQTYSNMNIQDGEFLRYGQYVGGEKNLEYLYVTKKFTNDNGELNICVYLNIVSVSRSNNKQISFKKWPVTIVIDPYSGSTIESIGTLETNQMKDFAAFGVGGLVYWHYKLNRSTGYVEYTSKSLKDMDKGVNEVLTRNYKIKIKKNCPSADAFSLDLISCRFIDSKKPGIMYWVVPDFLKEPLQVTIKFVKLDTLTVKAGTFRVQTLSVLLGDTFLNKLMAPFLKSSGFWVEDSDRRLIIKEKTADKEIVLEEISNVN